MQICSTSPRRSPKWSFCTISTSTRSAAAPPSWTPGLSIDLLASRKAYLEFNSDLDWLRVERWLTAGRQLKAEEIAEVQPWRDRPLVCPCSSAETAAAAGLECDCPFRSKHTCSAQLFEAQVNRNPDAVAVVYDRFSVELNRRANRLAYYLREQGGPDVVVLDLFDRSVDLAEPIGGHEGRGAYLPLVPCLPRGDWPPRWKPVLGLYWLLNRRSAGLPRHQPQVLCLIEMPPQLPIIRGESSPLAASHHLVSGGSVHARVDGQLKGARNRAAGPGQFPRIHAAGADSTKRTLTALAITPLSFDIAGLELYLLLIVGACIKAGNPARGLTGWLAQALDRAK
ncbi:MAG: hypothetical protein U0361_05910 [Nitrospiraceae bacterium]